MDGMRLEKLIIATEEARDGGDRLLLQYQGRPTVPLEIQGRVTETSGVEAQWNLTGFLQQQPSVEVEVLQNGDVTITVTGKLVNRAPKYPVGSKPQFLQAVIEKWAA